MRIESNDRNAATGRERPMKTELIETLARYRTTRPCVRRCSGKGIRPESLPPAECQELDPDWHRKKKKR